MIVLGAVLAGVCGCTGSIMLDAMKEQARQFARQVLGAELLKNEAYRLFKRLFGINGRSLGGHEPDVSGKSEIGDDTADRSHQRADDRQDQPEFKD